MRRNEVGAHYSVLYIYVLHSIQYCSLFLQITVHSAHAQKRSWCSLQCTVTTALCSYRLLYTVRMRRNEVGAHYSTVYYSSNYLQYCSLFLQITVHSAHAQKRSWCSFQCTVLYTSIIQYCSLFLQLSVLCACAERKEVFSLQV